MVLKLIKYTGILTLISSYAVLLYNGFTFGWQQEFTSLFNIAWILGTASLILNAVYAIKINVSDWLFSVFGLNGLIWLAPFLIEFDGSFGIPALILFFAQAVYIHLKEPVVE